MARRNQANESEDIARTLVGVAAGAAVAFGAYKLFNSVFGSDDGPVQYEAAHTSSRHSLTARPLPIRSTHHQFPLNCKIVVAETQNECRDAINLLQSHCNEYPVLGFDCEWVSETGGRRKIALLQLASYRGLCVLIRLCDLETIPSPLKDILKDDDILKVGVGITRDAQYLSQDYGLSVLYTLELGYMADVAKCEGIKKSLDFLSEKYLGHPLGKEFAVRCSDWEAYALTDKQIEYAALDALVAIELFNVFAQKIDPTMHSNRLRRVFDACSEYLGRSDR
ncbi:exonuclease 3'-5' domain-containing protein 2-like isoform X2 [Bradysia coprophila]|nr:exonuclease 3'-5' domain-containing protein 2-like isoform X2 [Bradysia coprophila]